MISLVTQLKDGTSLESMTVGREGFAGLPIFHGVPISRRLAMCQIEGEFLRLSAKSFTSLVKDAPQLALLLHRYSQLAHEVVAQTAACNSMHLIEQRCARWLLISSDAVGTTGSLANSNGDYLSLRRRWSRLRRLDAFTRELIRRNERSQRRSPVAGSFRRVAGSLAVLRFSSPNSPPSSFSKCQPVLRSACATPLSVVARASSICSLSLPPSAGC